MAEAFYHVMARGIRRERIFRNESDRLLEMTNGVVSNHLTLGRNSEEGQWRGRCGWSLKERLPFCSVFRQTASAEAEIVNGNSNSTAKNKLDPFCRHPLTLLLVGTLTGSVLIPWVAGRANKQAVLTKARVKEAIDVMTTSNSVNAILNKMMTALDTFEKYSAPESQEDYRRRREEHRHKIDALYADFDSIAWWWPWNAYNQARVLRLIPPAKLDQFKDEIMKCTENLKATTDTLGPAWRDLPDDPRQAQHEPVMPTLRKRLDELRRQRDDIVQHMASLFQ
jgi:hypothetical protein